MLEHDVHLAARFRAESRLAPKAWLDLRRAAAAEHKPEWSDLAAGDIAYIFEFPDILAIYQFFSRIFSERPRRWREPTRA